MYGRPKTKLGDLQFWNNVEGGNGMLLQPTAHWQWTAGSVMCNVRGVRQSIRVFLHRELGGEPEFGFPLPTDRAYSIGPNCGVWRCVNPWHAAAMSKSQMYHVRNAGHNTAGKFGSTVRAWILAGGVPLDKRRELETAIKLDGLPVFGPERLEYQDLNGDNIVDAGNWYGGSGYFPYAVRWEVVPMEDQIVGADIARRLMVERGECWGHQLLSAGEHFTPRMVEWINQLSPEVLHKEPDWGKCYGGVVRPGEVQFPNWQDTTRQRVGKARKIKG